MVMTCISLVTVVIVIYMTSKNFNWDNSNLFVFNHDIMQVSCYVLLLVLLLLAIGILVASRRSRKKFQAFIRSLPHFHFYNFFLPPFFVPLLFCGFCDALPWEVTEGGNLPPLLPGGFTTWSDWQQQLQHSDWQQEQQHANWQARYLSFRALSSSTGPGMQQHMGI